MKKVFLSISTLCVATLLFLIASCSKNNSPANPNVLVTHASPDAPGVDLYVNGTKVNPTALTYANNTGYLSVAAGATNVKVDVTGTMTTVINADLNLSTGANYSIFAIDSVSNIQPLVLVDTLTVPSGNNAGIRFIHLSPNAPAVDILDSASLTVLISNVSFKGYTSFLTFPAGGPSTLYVCAHGSTTPVVTIPSFVPASGHIYTIFAKGFLGGTGTQALGYQVITNK